MRRTTTPRAMRAAGLGRSGVVLLSLGVCFIAGQARAEQPPASLSDLPADLWSRDTLLDDAGRFRTKLSHWGLSVGLQDTNEAFGNPSGGIHQGAAYSGLTMFSVGLDTEAAFGWVGGTFNASVFNIRGRGLSADNLLALQTVSGIVAVPTTRLWEFWFQQSFGDRFDVKIGQQSLDVEFMLSAGSSVFLNTMMGWPMMPSVDLYAGGPAYPLASLGVRFRARLSDSLSILAGVFDDNPPGGSFAADSQLRGAERSGTLFNLNTGALFIVEAQYVINQPRDDGAVSTGGLPGVYKLGAWFDTARFPSQQFDNTGLSLADPASSGIAKSHSRDFSIYAVVDQTIWQPDPGDPFALSVFARVMGGPGDRNLINFSINAGVTLKAPLPGRDNDTVGLGFGVAKVSGGAIALDRARNVFSQTPAPVRSAETFIELTYQAQVAPWWVVQPDFQYIFNPGGGIQNPNNPGRKVGDEAVFGLRSVVTF